VPFLFGNFQVFLKNLVKNVQFRYATTGKFFRYPKVPLEASAPPPPPPRFRGPCTGTLIWDEFFVSQRKSISKFFFV
jgi:hypothetical protein